MKPFFCCFSCLFVCLFIFTCSYSSALKSLDLEILMQWLRFLVKSLFLSPVQISFIKVNDLSTSVVKGEIKQPSRMMVIISLWRLEKGESIQNLIRLWNVYLCWWQRVTTSSSNFWMFFSILIRFCLLDIDLISSFEFCSCFKGCLALANPAFCWFYHLDLSLKTKVLNTLYWTGKIFLQTRQGITTLFNFTFSL